MRARRLLVVLSALIALQGLLLPGDGQAHDSSYCGHEEDGYTIVTRYVSSREDQRGHWHQYRHLRYGMWDVHEPVWMLCNGTH